MAAIQCCFFRNIVVVYLKNLQDVTFLYSSLRVLLFLNCEIFKDIIKFLLISIAVKVLFWNSANACLSAHQGNLC